MPSGYATTTSGYITTAAGGRNGDGFQAQLANLALPASMTLDPQRQHLFIADTAHQKVRRVELATGVITTVAGSGGHGFAGDGGPATRARFSGISAVAADRDRNLYVGDGADNAVTFTRIRRVDASTGIITTIAGSGDCTAGADSYEGLAENAPMCGELGGGMVAADDGSVYFTNWDALRVQRLYSEGGHWYIATVVGSGTSGTGGDGGPALQAQFKSLAGLGQDANGNLYVSDPVAGTVRRINTSATPWTIEGISHGGYPYGLWTDVAAGAGSIYYADPSAGQISKVELPSGKSSVVAGNGVTADSCGDGLPAILACLDTPAGVAVDAQGNIYISDVWGSRVRVVRPPGIIDTFVGTGCPYPGDGRAATDAGLCDAQGVAFGPDGAMYIGDTGNHRVRKIAADPATHLITPESSITTVAGTGTPGYNGDGIPATQAQLGTPNGVAVDREGNIYIADTGNDRVRKVDTSGTISTVAGIGVFGYSGDGGPAILAQLGGPVRVAYDDDRHLLYVDDYANYMIRRVDASGTITRVAGNGTYGYSGDGGDATQAALRLPWAIALDPNGALYISDTGNNRIRRVENGVIETVVGTGTGGFSGDGGPPLAAQIASSTGLGFDTSGNLYFAEFGNSRIRKVNWSTNTIDSIAGDGTGDNYYGDDGPALEACLGRPGDLVVDRAGNVFFADYWNWRIRRIEA
jgi:sugar lactone lactonase YvrE